MNIKGGLERTELYKRIFIDTNPFIYLLEGVAPYDIAVRDFLFEGMCAKTEFCTSTITDALQLASAICSECDMFLTNDKQLRQVEEIQVLLVNEL